MTTIAEKQFMRALVKQYYPEKYAELHNREINLTDEQKEELMKSVKKIASKKIAKMPFAKARVEKKVQSPVQSETKTVSVKQACETKTSALRIEAARLGIKYPKSMDRETLIVAIDAKAKGDVKVIEQIEAQTKIIRTERKEARFLKRKEKK